MAGGNLESAGGQSGRSHAQVWRRAWSDSLDVLRQNDLLSESRFLSFAKDRGTSLHGVTTGEPGEFYRRGWLEADGLSDEGQPLFHPFRIYPLIGVLRYYRHPFSVTLDSTPERAASFAARMVGDLPPADGLSERSPQWNDVVDLAILLEPLYWHRIVGHLTRSAFVEEAEYGRVFDAYRGGVLEFIAGLDIDRWREEHESLRIEGARADANADLYLLLRLSDWNRRKRLEGVVSLALWLRHMAEVVRRGFEEVHGVEWSEEDEAFGFWAPDGRQLTYGASRPLDDLAHARRRVASNYRLHTGSIVRWYVEGDTEYHAIVSVLPRPAFFGIELVNLRGQIAGGRDNTVLRLRDGLMQDIALGRFSMISFDTDVAANVKAVRRHVEAERVVGSLHPNEPDFEFANFTLPELVEIAAALDEDNGVEGDAVREAEWAGMDSAKFFEARYCEVSRRGRSLKGRDWGEALAAYADAHPARPDTGGERPLMRAIGNAVRSRHVAYDLQKERWTFDPLTFAPVERASSDDAIEGGGDSA